MKWENIFGIGVAIEVWSKLEKQAISMQVQVTDEQASKGVFPSMYPTIKVTFGNFTNFLPQPYNLRMIQKIIKLSPKWPFYAKHNMKMDLTT